MAPKTRYKSPLDIPYIKQLIFSLNILGSWPHELMGEKKWFSEYRSSKILFIYLVSVSYIETSYILKVFSSSTILEMGLLFMNTFGCYVAVHRITLSWTKLYKDVTFNLFNKIHLFYYKNKSGFANKIFEDVEKWSSFLTKLIHYELCAGIILYNITPLYKNYTSGMFDSVKPPNGTYDQNSYYDLPLDYTTNLNSFLIVYIFNWFVSADVASIYGILDLYVLIIVLQLWGHLKIIKHDLRSFPKPINTNTNTYPRSPWYDDEEAKEIKQLLLESMEHYRTIKKFMNDFSMGFGAMICVYHFFHQVLQCVLLVEMSQLTAEAIARFGMVTLNTFHQLIQMSFIFELIGSQSETVKDALYDVPWECMGTDNRKIVLMYLCYVQRPMHFKALGVLPVGFKTMTSILKTSMSYYFMLIRFSTTGHE